MSSRSRWLGLASVLLLIVGLTTPAHAATLTRPITDHGAIPLTANTVAGAASGMMPDGSARTWAVVNGKPAYLAEIDPLTGTTLARHDLPGASGAWGVELGADGTVWVAAYSAGRLYRLPFGASQVQDLGQATRYSSFLWQVDSDAAGRAYVGTFEGFAPGTVLPGAHLVSYDPATSQWRDYGDFGAAYTYIRSTAVVGDTVYVGTGTTAAMFAVDIATGAKTQVPLPEGRTDCQFTYEMATSGTDLWVRFECTKKNYGYVYDTVAKSWKAGPFANYMDQRVGTDAAGNTWFTNANNLQRRTPQGTVTATSASIAIKGIGVVSAAGKEYVVGMGNGVLDLYDIAAGTVRQFAPALPGTPVTPRSTAVGPTGSIHVGGYFSGGFATFAPRTGTWSFDPRLGQAENMVTVGGRLYAGIYPGAKIVSLDPGRPLGPGNTTPVFDLTADGQDRPFGMTNAGGVLAVGTVPGYGSLTSVLALYDPATGKVEKFPNLVTDHSITSLAYADGVLYGGTSIYGGNGIAPTQANGRVFAFDMATRTLRWNVEIPGHAQVTSVAATADGEVVAATHGSLFALDSASGHEVWSTMVTPYDWSQFSGGTWQFDTLYYRPADRFVYGTVGGKVVRVKTVGRHQVDTLAGARGIKAALDATGRLYWVDGQNLRSASFR